ASDPGPPPRLGRGTRPPDPVLSRRGEMTLDRLRELAAELDRTDPLAHLRERFHIPRGPDGREVAYLCGNSLGLAPRKAREYVDRELAAWEQLGVEGHFKPDRPWV